MIPAKILDTTIEALGYSKFFYETEKSLPYLEVEGYKKYRLQKLKEMQEAIDFWREIRKNEK